MKIIGLLLALCGFGFGLIAQEEMKVNDSTRLRLDVGFDIGFGRLQSELNGELPALDRFLLQNDRYGNYSFTFPDIDLVFFERVGLRAASFASFYTDKNNFTEAELQAVVPDYYTQTDGLNNQSAFNSTKDAFSFTRFKLGLSGYFRSQKKLKIIPYADLYVGLKTTYPVFDILFKEKNSNVMFTRTYEYSNLKSSGYAFGVNTRLYSMIKNTGKRKVNYFVNLHLEYAQFKTTGLSYYTDSDFYGNTSLSASTPFTRTSSAFKIGFCITGIGFQFARK